MVTAFVETYKGWSVYNAGVGGTGVYYALGGHCKANYAVTTSTGSIVATNNYDSQTAIETKLTQLDSYPPFLISQSFMPSRTPTQWGYNSTFTGAEISAVNFFPNAVCMGIRLNDILFNYPSSGSTAGLATMHICTAIGATISKFSVVTVSTFALADQG